MLRVSKMEDFQKAVLDDCLVCMREELEPSHISKDLEKGLLSAAEVEEVNTKPNQREQVDSLVSILQTKDKSSFYNFLQILKSYNDYTSIYKTLSEKEAKEKNKIEEIVKELTKYPGVTADYQFQEMLVNIAKEFTKPFAKRLCEHFKVSNEQDMGNYKKKSVAVLLKEKVVSVTNQSKLLEICETLRLDGLQNHIASYQEKSICPELVVRLENLSEKFVSILKSIMQDSVVLYWKSRVLNSLFLEDYGIHYINLNNDNFTLKVSLRLTSLKSFHQLSEHMNKDVLANKISNILFNDDYETLSNDVASEQEKMKMVFQEGMKEQVLQHLKELDETAQEEQRSPSRDTQTEEPSHYNKSTTAESDNPMTAEHKRILHDHIDLLVSDLHVDTVWNGLSQSGIFCSQETSGETQQDKRKRFACLVEFLTSAEDSTFYRFLNVLKQTETSKHIAEVLRLADIQKSVNEKHSSEATPDGNDTSDSKTSVYEISLYAKMKLELCGYLTKEVLSRLSILLDLNPAEREKVRTGFDFIEIVEQKGILSEGNVASLRNLFKESDLQSAAKVVDEYQNHLSQCERARSGVDLIHIMKEKGILSEGNVASLRNVFGKSDLHSAAKVVDEYQHHLSQTNKLSEKKMSNQMSPLYRKILNAMMTDMSKCLQIDETAMQMMNNGIFSEDEVQEIKRHAKPSESVEKFMEILETKDDQTYLSFQVLMSRISDLLSIRICYFEAKFKRQESRGSHSRKTDEFFSDLSKLTTLDLMNDCMQNDSTNPIRVVLIGKTGVGKSSTGNTLIGKKKFQIPKGSLFSSCTRTIELHEITSRTPTLEVMDTPGIFDTSWINIRQADTNLYEIAKAILEFREGIDVYLLVCRSDIMFTVEETKTISQIQKRFGKEIYRHCLVVLTHGKLYRKNYNDLNSLFADEKLPKGLIQLLQDVGQNVVLVENEFEGDTFEKELMREVLLSSILRFVSNNEGKRYSNKIFENVQKRIEEERKSEEKSSNARKYIFSYVYIYITTESEVELNRLNSELTLGAIKVEELQNDIKSKFDIIIESSTIQSYVRQKVQDCADMIEKEIKRKKRKREEEMLTKQNEEKQVKDKERKERKQNERNKIQTRIKSAMLLYIETSTEETLKSLLKGNECRLNDALKPVQRHRSQFVSSDNVVEMAKRYVHHNKDLIQKKITEKETQKKKRKEESIELATQIMKNKLNHHMAGLSEKDLQKLKERGTLTKKQLSEYDIEFKDSEFKDSIKAKDIVPNIIKDDVEYQIKCREMERRKIQQMSEAKTAVHKCVVSYIEMGTEESLKKLLETNAVPEECLQTMKGKAEDYRNADLKFDNLVEIAKEYILHNRYIVETKLQDIKKADRQLQLLKHKTTLRLQSILEKHLAGLTEDELHHLKEAKILPQQYQAKVIEEFDYTTVNNLVGVELMFKNFLNENIDKYISLKKEEKQRRHKADEILRAKQLICSRISKFIATGSMKQVKIMSDPRNVPHDILKFFITPIEEFKFLSQDDLLKLCQEIIIEQGTFIERNAEKRIQELEHQLTTLRLEAESTLTTKIAAYLKSLSTSTQLDKIKADNNIPEKTLFNISAGVIPSEIKSDIMVEELAKSVIKERIDVLITKKREEEEAKERQNQLQKFENIVTIDLFTSIENQSETNLQKLLDLQTYPEDELTPLKKRMEMYKHITINDLTIIVKNFVKRTRALIEMQIASKKQDRQDKSALESTKIFFTFAETLTEEELQGLKLNFEQNFPSFLSKNGIKVTDETLEVLVTVHANVEEHIDGYITTKQEEKRQAEEQERERQLGKLKKYIQNYISEQITKSDEKQLNEFLNESYPGCEEVTKLETIAELGSIYYDEIKPCVIAVINDNKNEIMQTLQTLKTIREKQEHDALLESTKVEITNIVNKYARVFLRNLGKEELKKLQADGVADKLPDKIVNEIKQKMSHAPDLDDNRLKEIIRNVIQSRITLIEDIVKHEVCFPNASIVTTKQRGKISIALVEVGDSVLTVHENSQVTFEDIFFLAHSENSALVCYLNIQTEKQKSIRISPKHYLHVGDLYSLKLADKVMVNDKIFFVKDDAFIPDRVISVKYEYLQGAHCPYTLSGTLIVDDIAASCFTSTLSPSITKGLLAPLRLIYYCTPLSLYKLIFTPKVMFFLARTAKLGTDFFLNYKTLYDVL